LEVLEVRQLLSTTLNVVDFGARPNDGGDDTGAFEAAIDASKKGDTILVPDGVFDLPDGLKLVGDRTYQGIDGATLRGKNDEGWLLKFRGDDATFTGLTLEGGGLFMEQRADNWRFNRRIVIDNNVFRLDTNGGDLGSGIAFTTGLEDSRITNNSFTGDCGVFAIYGYNYDGLTISNNEVVDTTAGFHIDAHGASDHLVVSKNYISGVRGMGMEFQGSATNLKFLDNVYEHPRLSSDYNRNLNSMAFSLILDKSSDIEIKRNMVIAPERPDGTGCRVGFEVGGDNTIVEDNYINGVSITAYCTDGSGSASVTMRNNKFMNYQHGDYIAFPSGNRTYSSSNNGPDTQLSWDVNRAKPGRLTKHDDNGGGNKGGNKDANKGKSKPQELSLSQTEPDESDPGKKSVYNPDDFDYVSDLDWKSSDNSWGPVERDQTNGERDLDDGSTIKLNGRAYGKGLGVTVDSDVVLNLDGKYSRFFSDVGIDDHMGVNGSMTFQVWADGKKVFDSGKVTGSTPIKGVTVKTNGVQQLRLVTTAAGDGADYDHGVWAAARLLPVGKGPDADLANRA
jgi:hypothetical protein